MAKDPAFLFYSKDYYEGTRTMLPEERACYVDLMIYQHQHGLIPNDLRRVLMYCSGVDEATLKATLEAKFTQTENGWVNMKLQDVIDEREDYKEGQSKNGKVGQFWKKAKAILNKADYTKLKDFLYNFTTEELYLRIDNLEINEATLKAMLIDTLEGSLKHIAIEDAIVIKEDNNLLIEAEFEKFWNLYDKKVGEKEKLLSKWAKLKPIERNKIFETLPKYVASAEKKFRKNPETYLNNKAWNDEIIIEPKKLSNGRHREVSAESGERRGNSTL